MLKDPKDYTELRLLYANSSPADVLLKQELEAFAREHDNFKVWFTGAVLRPSSGASVGKACCKPDDVCVRAWP